MKFFASSVGSLSQVICACICVVRSAISGLPWREKHVVLLPKRRVEKRICRFLIGNNHLKTATRRRAAKRFTSHWREFDPYSLNHHPLLIFALWIWGIHFASGYFTQAKTCLYLHRFLLLACQRRLPHEHLLHYVVGRIASVDDVIGDTPHFDAI